MERAVRGSGRGITTFERYLDRFMDEKRLGYEPIDGKWDVSERHFGQHGQVVPRSIFLCCITL